MTTRLRIVVGMTMILVSSACVSPETIVVTTSTLVDPTTTAGPEPVTTSVTTSTTEPATTTTSATSTTTVALPAFPPGRENLTHGGDAWVVVLAASEDGADPALSEANADAEDAGYVTGPTDCDFGAATALGLPDDRQYYTVSVYLSSEADAHAALEAFLARGVDGAVGLVQTYCMD